MALLLNKTPLHFAFRYAVPLSGEAAAEISADRCVLIRSKEDVSAILPGAFVLADFSKNPLCSQQIPLFWDALAERRIAGACFFLPPGEERACRALLAKKASSIPVCTIIAPCDLPLMLDGCLNLLAGAYIPWLSSVFSKRLAEGLSSSKNAPRVCLQLLNEFLGCKAGLFFPDIHFPLLSGFYTDEETLSALAPLLSAHSDAAHISFQTPKGQAYAFSVRAAQNALGYLTLSSCPSLFPDTDFPIIQECLPHIASYVLELMRNLQYQQRSRDAFFHDLLFTERSRDPRAIIENARLLDCPVEQRRTVLTVWLSGAVKTEDIFTRQLLPLCPFPAEYYAFPEPTLLVLLIAGNIPDCADALEMLLRPFLAALNDQTAVQDCHPAVMGVGKPFDQLYEVADSCYESLALLRIGYILTPDTDIYLFDRYLLYYMVDYLKESTIFLKLYSSTVDKLRDYHGDVGLEMLHTLSVLSSCNFSVQKAAGRLFLHRNSLYDRLAAICDILEMDLKSQENQLLIHLLLILDQLLRNAPSAFQSVMFSSEIPKREPVIQWQYQLPYSPELYPEALEFDRRIQELAAIPHTLENLLNLANTYIRHPIDLISAEDFSGFTKHNSLILLNISNVLEKSASQLQNAGNFICFRMGQLRFIALKVMRGNHILAYLTINYEQSGQASAAELQVLERLSPYVAVWMLSQNNSVSSKSKLEFYRNLMIDHFQCNDKQLRRECFRFGVSVHRQRYVAIISHTFPDCSGRQQVLDEIERLFSDTFHVFRCGNAAGSATLLLETAGSGHTVNMPVFLSQLSGNISQRFPASPVRISISQSCQSIDKLSEIYKEANFAITLGSALHPDRQVYYYKDYIIYHMISTMWGSPIFQHLHQSMIEPLLKYDKKYRANLLDALIAYADANFYISKASRCSGLHRNTLHKKILKIQELLSVDLSVPQDQIILQMAVNIHRLKNVYPQTEQTLLWVMPSPEQQQAHTASGGQGSALPPSIYGKLL